MKNPGNSVWGTLLENNEKVPLIFYLIDNVSVSSTLANFLNVNQNSINGFKVANAAEMVSAVQKNQFAMGFCKITDIQDATSQNLVENIKLLPIDKNGNGQVDYNEQIYDDLNSFSRGVWIGKYPKALFSSIYAVTDQPPSNESEVAFLKWVITDGQLLVNSAGHSELALSERQTKVDALYENINLAEKPKDNFAIAKVILMVVALFVVLGFIVNVVIRQFQTAGSNIVDKFKISSDAFSENTVAAPKGLYFDKTHTWAFMEKDGVVKVGIDDFLQHVTGPITRIKMKNSGEKVKKGEPIVSIIQNGKQLKLSAPISGTIIEHNNALKSNSLALNNSPYSDGWVYMIEPSNWLRDIQFLSMADKYKNWLKSEFSRLKDFLAITMYGENLRLANVILQDGGEFKDGILADLGPEVWEDFQTKFIDNAR